MYRVMETRVNGFEIKPGANLTGANLTGADLAEADLSGADLSGADLSRANLFKADLTEANLTGADLAEADLTRSTLNRADLSGADLTRANLLRADLLGANLIGANLLRADLLGARLNGARLSGSRLPDFQIAQDVELIGWKKGQGGAIIELRIPPQSRRTGSLVSSKCRCEYAEVISTSNGSIAISMYDPELIYRAGEVVRPDSYNDDPRLDCTNGIHFFLTREEAEAYRDQQTVDSQPAVPATEQGGEG